ncbi:MAG: tRNA (N(6)-L-threonylcarbamoyladenosine(37)-C(2))-methylthiotransferase MtaB [Treponema sp.]|nr:tRNA (N(6)-L-threonylcarbamoyladenosine(37)-C(2))-methylthiotransferase MtaB [Treponema sp.]MEE3434586.1 tRNA (N(6)-L-threonylcarbamoyladenosine(37)-C(2))-methylthiotransferase MtaB [Treponema sp.]
MALNKTVRFETLGCRLNQIETEGAAEFFYERGWSVQMASAAARDAEDPSVALCVLNTCAVTGKAEQKARRTINLLLKKFPAAALIVTGCYAQLSPAQIAAMDERAVVLPGKAKSALSKVPEFLEGFLLAKQNAPKALEAAGRETAAPELLAAALRECLQSQGAAHEKNLSQGQKAPGLLSPPSIGDYASEPFALNPKTFFAHSRSSIKIQDGCDNCCSFCAIHIARGKSVSIPASLALERVVALEEAGQSEVVLTGVNIGQYKGEWQGGTVGIAELLELILERTQKIAVRFSSIYPETVTERFAQAIKNPRVRPHFHISVQSGSDEILKRMNRRYTRQTVIQACRRLKEAKQNPFLACDIITGFPGETDDGFAQTLSLLKEAGFVNAHAFPYSPRPGTAAASFTPKIPERVKDQRVAALNEYSAAAKIAYINSFAGTVRPAIAESVHGSAAKNVPQGKKLLRATTDNFIHCEILLDQEAASPKDGQPIMVKILAAKEDAVRQGAEWEALAELA